MDNTLARITAGWRCRKRDGKLVTFDVQKIRKAVTGCLTEINHPVEQADALAEAVASGVVARLTADPGAVPSVEHVQRLVIQWLWSNGMFDAAEAYQNYREHHRKKRELETACIFDRRATFKPFDYPDAVKFKEAIQHSYWLVTEWNFVSDVQDFSVHLTGPERSAITRTLLAISQVEVAVKMFWAKLGDRIRRPEFVQVGVVFAESEVRHSDAYSHLLEVLGLNDLFRSVADVPALRARVDYLNRDLRASSQGDDRSFIRTLALFSLFVENVSLFSQFAVMKAFAKHRKCLNNVDNVVQATIREEVIHGLFGVYLINLARADRPEWFGPEFYAALVESCRDALAAETHIIDWIFESGRLPFVSRSSLIEFVKSRFNEGLTAIGGPAAFAVDHKLLEPLRWFVEELHAQVDVDFFHKRSTSYSSKSTSVTAADLF